MWQSWVAGVAIGLILVFGIGSRLSDRLGRFAEISASAFIAALAAFAALVAGVVASIYPEPVRQTAPLQWIARQGAIAFWVLAFLALLLAALHVWGGSRVRRREVEELKSRSDELARTVRTLPPEAFLNRFGGALC